LVAAGGRRAQEAEGGSVVVARDHLRELAILDGERRADVGARGPGDRGGGQRGELADGDLGGAAAVAVAVVEGAAGADPDRGIGGAGRAVGDLGERPAGAVVGRDEEALLAAAG